MDRRRDKFRARSKVFGYVPSVSVLCIIAFSFAPETALSQNSFTEEGCAETSSNYHHNSTRLESFIVAPTYSGGLQYDQGVSGLKVSYEGGVFNAVGLGIAQQAVCPAAGDFDNDGWEDFVSGMNGQNQIRFFKNRTGEATNCPNSCVGISSAAFSAQNCGASCDSDAQNRVWVEANQSYTPALGPETVRRPKFVPVGFVQNMSRLRHYSSQRAGFCNTNSGDFDKDGNLDFVYFRRSRGATGNNKNIKEATLWYGKGDGTFDLASGGHDWVSGTGTVYDTLLAAPFETSDLGKIIAYVDNTAVYDWNHDGWPDIIWGNIGNSSHTGQVRALINNCPDIYDATNPQPCSVKPKFEAAESDIILANSPLADSAGTNAGILNLALGDVTNDGIDDLVIAGRGSAEAAIVPGAPTGGIDLDNIIKFPNAGYHTFLSVQDFSLDGKKDIILGTEKYVGGSKNNIGACWMTPDNNGDFLPDSLPPTGVVCETVGNKEHGGYSYFFLNDGTATPFLNGWIPLAKRTGAFSEYDAEYFNTNGGISRVKDWDIGIDLDYDRDPQKTKDMIVADGNNNQSYFVFANRVTPNFAACGSVESDALELGNLSTSELVVTAVKMTPSPLPNIPTGTSISYQASNDDGNTWHDTYDCDNDVPGNGPDWCVEFPDQVGRTVRWKTTMCSNSSRDVSPTFYGMDISFDYAEAREHFRASVVVNNGIAYLGGFQQPNNKGKFYGLNAGLTTKYFELGETLDNLASENLVYAVANDKQTLLPFQSGSEYNPNFQAAIGGNIDDAIAVLSWGREKRFGMELPPNSTASRLGAIMSGTPAILTPPVRPFWYEHASTAEKTVIHSFMESHKDREVLALIGSMDGQIHATRVNTDFAAPFIEHAWSIIPNSVVSQMLADMTQPFPNAFPDASPTLADVLFSDGTMHTIMVTGMGKGGRSVMAIDVTDTLGGQAPQPLWEIYPGGSSTSGFTTSKPIITWLEIEGKKKFAAIFASGADPGNQDKGKIVTAVALETGAQLWQFETACPISTDIVSIETDSTSEPILTSIDGIADYVLFADSCGNIYKIDPNKNESWNESSPGRLGLGNIDTGSTSSGGHNIYALFSTTNTSNALGSARPIAGTLGASKDSSNRVILFFGTGGVESFNPALPNEFYAVYLDSGLIRDKLVGACEAGQNCEKFYGGVVLTNDQVILSRAIDPNVGTAVCDAGSSIIEGFDIDNLSDLDFSVPIATGAAVSGLFGDAGAIYISTLAGDVIRIGDSSVNDAGDGGTVGEGGTGAGGNSGGLGFTSQYSWSQLH